MASDTDAALRILKQVPTKYRGPGGAVAVLKDGNLIAHHVWGYADMEKRIPMTADTVFPICSITKQFVSALMLDLSENPPATMANHDTSFKDQMLSAIRTVIPSKFIDESNLNVENLIDMCSGLRDYWALCTLQGSDAETPYSLTHDNEAMLKRIHTLHFAPGTEYSYSNTNFNIAERIIEKVTNDTFSNLLTTRILRPAGMLTAHMCPRTDRLPGPIIGYEGSVDFGFIPARNNIEWSADAGLTASLSDMIAYETSFDSKYLRPNSSYQKAITPLIYPNGAKSYYRHGLRHATLGNSDILTIGHGGALRGFKLHRRYVPSTRHSVIVLFNHSGNAGEATDFILKSLLSVPEDPAPDASIQAHPSWFGAFIDADTQLAVRIIHGKTAGTVKLLYARTPETLRLTSATAAAGSDVVAELDGDAGGVTVRRLEDNRVLKSKRLRMERPEKAVLGRYECEETESSLICEGDWESGMLYALFDGCWGKGPPHVMTHLSEDVWVFMDPRAMDDTPPGDWTCVFKRDEEGNVVGVTVGCWLARKLEFVKTR